MEETIEYKGFEIEVKQDNDPENPFTSWDCLIPLMWDNCERYHNTITDYSDGDIADFLANSPSDGQIIRHQKKIAELFEDIDLEYMKENEYSKSEKVDEIRWKIRCLNATFDQLEEYCNLMKIPCLSTSRSGYSQGDYVEIFTCYTDKFYKVTGASREQIAGSDTELKHNADLLGYWMFNDVFGYDIEGIDSCCGYYGDDHEESGLLEAARGAIDWHLKEKEEKRVAKLKTLIRNRVTLANRVNYQSI
jgi:hypothetical protein